MSSERLALKKVRSSILADIDLVKSLSILRKQFLQSGSSDFTIPGYIQRITAYPLSIIYSLSWE